MTTFGEKAKDWWTKGFQLAPCYLDDWDEIKSYFSKYGLTLNEHGPIITLNELKNVREAVRMTEMLYELDGYQSMINRNDIRELKGVLFMSNLYILPTFCREVSKTAYEKWMQVPDARLKEIFKLKGNMKKKESEIERLIKEEVIFLRKKGSLKL